MKKIIIPDNYNYIACFLTFVCNLKCSYCINYHEMGNFNKNYISGKDWVEAINKIESRPDLPITLQGGEATLHKDFYEIINGIKPDLNIDLLTNLQFDVNEFMRNVSPDRLKRDAPYASIRVSYHPEQMDEYELIDKVCTLQAKRYSIGIWALLHPLWEEQILQVQEKAKAKGIDFRTKEFLGFYDGKLYGTYKYADSLTMEQEKECLCKTTELIVGPNGSVYRCHHDIYENFPAIGNITDNDFVIEEIFRKCNVYGHCNPCDVKLKTNRFQKFGHTSVEIKF